MPAKKLKRFLDENHVRYVSIRHSPAYTAQETAASAHIPGRELAKTVMVQIDGVIAMAVLPSTRMLDLERLRQLSGAQAVTLAGEREFARAFPDCEAGAIPPVGAAYGLRTVVDDSLEERQDLYFEAGDHRTVIHVTGDEFHRLMRTVLHGQICTASTTPPDGTIYFGA